MRKLLQVFVLVALTFVLAPQVSAQTDTRMEKRQEAKLRVCQNREAAMKQRFERLNSMADKMLSSFDAKATRVKDYYTDKVIPTGKTVPDYDALVADIDTKKAAVETALTNAKASSDAFSCDAADPKTLLQDYRKSMQEVKSALKDYRTAIKNLIVAIRGVSGQSTPVPTQ
jgi:hypothetical protein